MERSLTNRNTYDFIENECRLNHELWKEYGLGIQSHTTDSDFWESLSDHLDCFRVCAECGRPMIEGFLIEDGDCYCSDNCLHKHISEEVYLKLYDDRDDGTYWTVWYEDAMTYKQKD